jgi:hypothetical protein
LRSSGLVLSRHFSLRELFVGEVIVEADEQASRERQLQPAVSVAIRPSRIAVNWSVSRPAKLFSMMLKRVHDISQGGMSVAVSPLRS